MTFLLWTALVIGQIFSAGNMNHQQENGYYEINPGYPKHPSKERIYYTKALSTLVVYGATEVFPKYENHILIGANVQVYGFILYDNYKGVSMSLVF